MSDNKPEITSPAGGLRTTDGGVSLDDLDNIINQMDPGFTDSLEGIKKEAVTDASAIEELHVESQVDVGAEEENVKANLRRRVLKILLAPWVKVRDWARLRWIALVNRARLFKEQSIQFIKFELPERIRYLKSRCLAAVAWGRGQIQRFLKLTPAQKLAAVLSVAFVAAALVFMAQALRGQWLPTWRNPIVTSFERHALFVERVRDKQDYVEFFQAFPEIEIPFLLSKIVVNLTPSPGKSRPMAAFEFYLGLDAKETAIEVKDREKEILDLVQRTVEEFTYDEVNSQVGQVRMKSRIRDAINVILNQGRVTRVYIKTIVTNF